MYLFNRDKVKERATSLRYGGRIQLKQKGNSHVELNVDKRIYIYK